MLKKIFVAVTLMFLASFSVYAQGLPFDPSVRMGKLDNGLTYYVRPNKMPGDNAFFYLVQRVGSLKERDDQRGLAHFLEHMCFNGTEHFPGRSLTDFLERHGIGGNFNAVTDMEYTTYHIDHVPTDQGVELLDSMLLILYDWSHGLTLDDKAIDKERNVIVEEWRSRNVGRQRLFYNAMPAIFAGSHYADCLPIGDMDIIRKFRPAQLKDYYERWYNPENQAVIVVGDVDADYVENAIKKLFGTLKRSKLASDFRYTELPGNKQPIVVVQKDKELDREELFIFRKMPPVAKEARNSMEYRRRQIMQDLVTQMLDARANAIGHSDNTPFSECESYFGNYYFSSIYPALGLNIVPREGRMQDALEACMTMLRQAAEHGFSQAECMRAAQWMHARMQQSLTISNRYNSSVHCQSLTNHYLYGNVAMEDTARYNVDNEILSHMNADDLNVFASEYLYTLDGSDFAVVSLNKDDGHVIPSQQDLLDVLQRVSAHKTEPYKDDTDDRPLMAQLPTPGEVVAVEKWNYGFDYVKCKNGLRLLIASSQNNPGRVVMKAWAPGGVNLVSDSGRLIAQMSPSVVNFSKKGGYKASEIERITFGKDIEMNWEIMQDQLNFDGHCASNDLETMLQQFYLTMTSLEPDNEVFATRRESLISTIKNMEGNPSSVFQDSINSVWLDELSHPWLQTPHADEIMNFDYEAAVKAFRELTSDAGAFVVFIVGQYDAEQINRLISTYLASLPGTSSQRYEDNIKNTRLYRGVKPDNCMLDSHYPMSIPQSYVFNAWCNPNPQYNIQNIVADNMLTGVLDKMLDAKVREEMGAAYSPQASTMVMPSLQGIHILGVQSSFPVKPEQTDAVKDAVEDMMKQIANGCDATLLQKTKEEYLNNFYSGAGQDQVVVSWLSELFMYDIDYLKDFEETVKAQTVESVSAYARKLLSEGRHFRVILRPQ